MESMITSTAAVSAAARSISTAPSPIRMARVADIPAIARITEEGPQPVGVEPDVMSRAARLFLTHIAFEHGALWVAQAPNGQITRAVTVIPASRIPPQQSVLRDMSRQPGGQSTFAAAQAWFDATFLAELRSVEPEWVLSEISKSTPPQWGDPALLGAALGWARAQPRSGCVPDMVLADSSHERAAACSLGFVEHPPRGGACAWWIGVAAPPLLA